MKLLQDVSLKLYSTMRLGGKAAYSYKVTSPEDVQAAAKWAEKRQLPIIMVGEGSNIIWKDEGFSGLLLINEIKGFEKTNEDSESVSFRFGAGERLDSVIEKVVSLGLSGMESLSLIPGNVGATPIQNVGAYGQDISQTLISVEAYDLETDEFVSLPNSACKFGYRTSIFKTSHKNRYLITAINVRLSRQVPKPPFYQSLQSYLDEHNIDNYDAPTIRKAVIAIRSSKLPDWHRVANCGSFFANPIVTNEDFQALKKQFPEIVGWEHEGGYKLAAAWLVEHAGFKAYKDKETGMATWDKQALVLVNESAKTTDDLLQFKQKIVDQVHRIFKVKLEQEPELLP